MITSWAGIADLVVPNGSNVSNILKGVYNFHDAKLLAIYSSGAYGAETYTLEVCQKQDAVAGDAWVTYQEGGVDFALPAAGKMKVSEFLAAAGSIRIKASANVAADRTFKINKLWST